MFNSHILTLNNIQNTSLLASFGLLFTAVYLKRIKICDITLKTLIYCPFLLLFCTSIWCNISYLAAIYYE